MVDSRMRSRAGIRATILASVVLAGCARPSPPERELRVAVVRRPRVLRPARPEHGPGLPGPVQRLRAPGPPGSLDAPRPGPGRLLGEPGPPDVGLPPPAGSALPRRLAPLGRGRGRLAPAAPRPTSAWGCARTSAAWSRSPPADPTPSSCGRSVPTRSSRSRLHFVLVVPRGSTAESLSRRANGTGPYAVAGWAPSSLSLQRNRAYWGDAPGLARVRIDLGVGSGRGEGGRGGSLRRPRRRPGDRGGGPPQRRYRVVEQESIFLRHLAFDVGRERTPFCPGIANPSESPRCARR